MGLGAGASVRASSDLASLRTPQCRLSLGRPRAQVRADADDPASLQPCVTIWHVSLRPSAR
eukprot:8881887-Pyramimonas_sp.AAC.1